MSDFNHAQMKHLLNRNNVSIVYLQAAGDYWIEQEKFCNEFRQVSLNDNIVIHVQFEGLSLTHSLVVPAVEKIIKETGRDPSTIFIFSPNSIRTDSPWRNIFWRQYFISDEFIRSKTYWFDSPAIEDDFKTWALFVGRRTTPRLLALYDIWQDPVLREQCLLSAMIHPDPASVQIFDHPDKIHDHLDQWIPVPIENKIQKILQHNNFREFCRNLPFGSIDGYSLTDQYTSAAHGENRNSDPSVSLIKLGGKYLFEITFETMTRGFTFTPSEKTVRTIVAEKPMLVYAPQNFLKYMQKEGFQTFEKLWDESYDQLEGPARYKAMMKIVKEVSELPKSQQLELYQKSREICLNNRLLLKKITINNGRKKGLKDANEFT